MSDSSQLTLSGLKKFEELKKYHEQNTIVFVFKFKMFVLCGQRLLKRSITVQLASLRICSVYHYDKRFFVTLFPSISARRRLATVIESRVKEFISLATMQWPWSISRLSDLLGDEETDFTSVFLDEAPQRNK